jgi:hypothetical protein
MLIGSKVLLGALSLCTSVLANGEVVKNDLATLMRKGRKRRTARSFATRIGERSPPYFESRKPNIQQNEILSQTTNLAEAESNPQNRDLSDGFDETAFWESYLLSGQDSYVPPPAPAPAYSPRPPPTYYPEKPPVGKPAEAPACKPICKYLPHEVGMMTKEAKLQKVIF